MKVKVTGQNFLYEWEALVTRNLHAKYEGSIGKGSKLMTNVKGVQQTNKPTKQPTDRAKTICPLYRYWGHKNHLVLVIKRSTVIVIALIYGK